MINQLQSKPIINHLWCVSRNVNRSGRLQDKGDMATTLKKLALVGKTDPK